MKKINFNKEQVGKIAKKDCEFAFYGVATVLSYVSVKDTLDVVRYSGSVDYSDVIGCIMNSAMYSSDKSKLVGVVPKDRDADFYKAIIKVVQSSMYSSDKVKVITGMCSED